MNFVIFHVEQIEVIFSQFLKMTEILVAYGVALTKGRSFEFAGANFGNIMGQCGAHSIL
jgi:hypothetical protein